MKIHVNTIRGDQGYGLLNIYDKSGYDYLEFYAYTDTDGIQIGAWWYGDTNLRKDNWTYVRLELRDTNLYDGRWTIRLMGDNIASANVWLSSMRLIVREENVLASVYNVYPIEYDWYQHTGAASFEYVTDKKYIGDDTQVKDNGSLKITGKNPNGEEYSFLSGDTLAQVIDNYSSVYFYVYTDSDNTDLIAGSWWCGDITIPKGVWTKVEFSVSANTNPEAVGGYDGQKIFSGDASAQRFAFRFQNLKEGDVIYVSSLYGVKAA